MYKDKKEMTGGSNVRGTGKPQLNKSLKQVTKEIGDNIVTTLVDL